MKPEPSATAPGSGLGAGNSPFFRKSTQLRGNRLRSVPAHRPGFPKKWGGGANRSAQARPWRGARRVVVNRPNQFCQRLATVGESDNGQTTMKGELI